MRRVGLAIGLLAVALALVACDEGTNGQLQDQRKDSIKQRSQAFARAENAAPTPRTVNFPLRKALVEFTKRQDLENHPWYVYILGLNGNAVAYYVAQTVPINSCNFLSSTEAVDSSDQGKVVITAPSLDGIFYGGGGASAGCDSWFFFDAATDALIQIRGVNWYAADQPLRVEAKAIKVQK